MKMDNRGGYKRYLQEDLISIPKSTKRSRLEQRAAARASAPRVPIASDSEGSEVGI